MRGVARFAAALLLAGAAIPGAFGSPDSLIARGDAADLRNDNAAALEIYLEAGKQRPDDPEILRRIAKQYAQLMVDARGDSAKRALGKQALAAAGRAAALDPRNAQARLSLAIVLGRVAFLEPPRQRIELSRRIRDEALAATRLDPREDLAWHVLGRWNYELANFNPFLRSLAELIYGKFPDASNEKAAEYFEKAIAVGPPRAVNHVEYGRALAALGRDDEARSQIQKGLGLPSVDKDDEETKRRGREALRRLR
jgi:tetratricopeptide (TPR) repeat protein